MTRSSIHIFSKNQSRAIRCASDVTKIQIKLLYQKYWNDVILEYLLKYKATKEVVSAMDIFTTFPTKEIIRKNNCKMRFLYKLVLKQDVDKKLMVNVNYFSMLEFPYTCDDNDMDNGVSKSTV